MNHNLKYFAISLVFIFQIIFQTPDIYAAPGADIERIERHRQLVIKPISRSSPIFETKQISARVAASSDLQVSETISPARFSQRLSSVVRINGDQFVSVWQDDRLGGFKIFAQLFDASGNPLSGNRLMISRADGYNLIEPKATPDGFGGFFLAWRDEVTGRIYAARYNFNLVQTVAPFAVNDTLSANYAGPYSIDSYPDGRLVVVWEEYSATNNIALRIFNSSGVPMTPTLKVNSDVIDCNHWVPSIAIIDNGGMAVAWEDYRNGNADIYMRQLNQDGSPNGLDFGVVQAAFDDSSQYAPEIAYSTADGFAIAWLDRRGGAQKVYLQRFVPGIGVVGSNINISGTDSSTTDWDISLAVNTVNNLIASWASVGAHNNIIVQRFSSGFALNGSPITVNQFSDGTRWETALAIGASDKIISTWTDYRAGNPDIYMQMITSTGNIIFTSDKLVNGDSQGAASVQPDIALIDNARAAAVFSSARADAGDIYLQLIGVAGNLIGTNIKINTDTIPLLQDRPKIAASSARLLVVWDDSRAIGGITGPRIFGRFGTSSASFSNPDFAISDASIVSAKHAPSVALSRNQTGLVTWTDLRNGTGQIFGRRVQEPANLLGNEFMISAPADMDNDDVTVCRDSSDNFTVVWLCRGAPGGPAAMVSRYNTAGGFLNKFSFNGNMAGTSITDIAAAVNDSGDVYLLWQGTSTVKHLYLTVFSKTGIIKNASLEVTDVANASPQEPAVAVDNNRYVIASWIDSRTGRRVAYYQVYNAGLSPAGSNTPFSTTAVEFMQSPAVAGNRGRAWYLWADPRSNGMNIFFNQTLYSPTAIEDNNPRALPEDFSLSQNYPNPFNPSTAIEFSIPTRELVEISIYNITGQKVATVTNKMYDAGHYTIYWSGHDNDGNFVSSGIYLYKMKAGGFSTTRKMTLVK